MSPDVRRGLPSRQRTEEEPWARSSHRSRPRSTIASGVVGRGMYDAAGAWGGTNPFPGPRFVLTHRLADQPAPEAGFTFVSGLDDALTQAAAAAGVGDVSIGGGPT
jgi:dihydrofolate reductase